tara:strand:- start:782 stop:958 length:177 start_codon:yes stop_codon:yes gene_type:complete
MVIHIKMITKQNYIEIAKILKKFFKGFNTKMLIQELTDYFKKDNPKFNKKQFIDAIFK